MPNTNQDSAEMASVRSANEAPAPQAAPTPPRTQAAPTASPTPPTVQWLGASRRQARSQKLSEIMAKEKDRREAWYKPNYVKKAFYDQIETELQKALSSERINILLKKDTLQGKLNEQKYWLLFGCPLVEELTSSRGKRTPAVSRTREARARKTLGRGKRTPGSGAPERSSRVEKTSS